MKIFSYILMAIGLMLVSACSSEQVEEPVMPADVCELVITLDADLNIVKNPQTRADNPWGEPYPEGEESDMERRIEDVSLYLVIGEEPLMHHYSLPLTRIGAEDGRYKYEATLELNSAYIHRVGGKPYLTARILALVNHPEKSDFANPFDSSPFSVSSIYDNQVIPMWGVTSVSDLELTANTSVDIGDIKMLRAVPKISIILDDEIKNEYKITQIDASENNYLMFGLIHPNNAESVSSTGDLMIEDCFNPCSDSSTATPYFYGLGTHAAWCYTAESRTPVINGTPQSFIVTLERTDGRGKPFTGKVYLCDYQNGKPNFNKSFSGLVRNHDYQFKIHLRELEFDVSFAKWQYGGKLHIELE